VAHAHRQAVQIMDVGHALATAAKSPPATVRQGAEVWRIGHDGARKALGMGDGDANGRQAACIDIRIQSALVAGGGVPSPAAPPGFAQIDVAVGDPPR
jgi:hypothetical protein